MKSFVCLLIIAFSCQSLLCKDVSDAEYEKPTGGVFVQGELPKRDISKDKIRTHTSTKVNTTRIQIEEVFPETTQESLQKIETKAQDEPQVESQDKPDAPPNDSEAQPQDEPKDEPQDEPQIDSVAIIDNTFLPCNFLPCPFNKKEDKNPKFNPAEISNFKAEVESADDVYEECQHSLELYHSLSLQLLLISLFCLTMILLLTTAFLAIYLTKNGIGLKRFRKLENRDCALNKYNF